MRERVRHGEAQLRGRDALELDVVERGRQRECTGIGHAGGSVSIRTAIPPFFLIWETVLGNAGSPLEMLIWVSLTSQGSFCERSFDAPARLSMVPLPTMALLQAASILIGLLACSQVQVGWDSG